MNNYNYGNTIYKSNQLIESCYNLTTAQNRLLYLAMTKLETRILDKNLNIKQVEDLILTSRFDLINIDIPLYKKIFKVKSNNLYVELAKVANDLFKSEIIYIGENNKVGKKRWVITCEYDDYNKNIAMQFHPDLVRDLLVMKSNYTMMIFDEFADKIKNKHAFRIYELCKQYLSIGYRDFYVDDLRFKLDLRDDEYERYYDFKNKVIIRAIKEINQYTDLQLEYKELEHIKRNVSKIRFYIKKINQKQISLFDNKPASVEEETSIMRKMSQILNKNISSEQAKQIFTTALTSIDNIEELKELEVGVVDYINEKIEVCNKYAKSKYPEKINYLGTLKKALEMNWKINEDYLIEPNTVQFNNFESRDYDYNALEDMLLGYTEYDANKLYKK